MKAQKKSLEALRRKVVLGCRVLYNEGIMNSHGHLSVRIPESDFFVITPRSSPAFAHTSELVVFDLDGRVVEGRNPPAEAPIHSTIYQLRKDVVSVSHFHSPMAIALGISGRHFCPLYGEARLFWAGVPLYNSALRIRGPEAASALAKTLSDKRAVLMRGHGAVVVGDSIEDTCVASIYLEDCARMQVICEMLGKPLALSKDEAAEVVELNRVWEYYVNRFQKQKSLRKSRIALD